ncbi:hypothetical protein Tco_1519003, partial [Tanacetum coccineum]
VKAMTETYTCIRSNKGGNKHATQRWIAQVVCDKLQSIGDSNYGIGTPKVLLTLDIGFETNGDKRCFQQSFVSLVACSMGFLVGCRPYISLNASYLKGKYNGVLFATTEIDGNNSIFPLGGPDSNQGYHWTMMVPYVIRLISVLTSELVQP